MAQWLETPAIVLAVLAALTILWKAAHWKGTVDEHRTTVTSFMKEIRDKIDRIFERLPPVPVKRGSSGAGATRAGSGDSPAAPPPRR